MRGWLIAGLGWAGCAAPGPEPTSPVEVAAAPATAEVSVVSAEAPRRGCLATVASSTAALEHVGAPVTVGERSFAPGWRRVPGGEVESVIVALDRDGGLAVTPVPVPYADPMALGGDAGGLTIVHVPTRGTGVLVRVALAADGSLAPGQPTPLPEVAWGWPGEILSDGTGARAWLVHAQATREQALGSTVLLTLDLAAGRVVASEPLPGGSQVRCVAGACASATVANGQVTVRRRGGPGEGSLAVAVNSACPAAHAVEGADEPVFVLRGDPWRAVRAGGAVAEAAIDGSLAGEAGCGSVLYGFPSAARPGLIEGTRARTLLRWDGRRGVFGAGEALPDPGHDRSERAAYADGVLEVAWSGWAGLAHSPSDREVRRYFKHWSFAGGQVALLRFEQGRWAAVDVAPLPLADARGTFHDGYAPVLLRHGLHAAVLLAPQGGAEPAYFQPYLRPCPAGQVTK